MLENIQRLCKARGIAISQLERDLDFGRGAIYKWDKSSPSIDKVQKVAEYFKESVDVVLYGFELTRFEELFRIIMNRRTCEQFANDTGIDLETVEDYAFGVTTEQPSLDLVKKLANSNPHKFIVDDESLFKAAGYSIKQAYEPETIAAHHDGEDWSAEELEEIERFKEFVRSKRQQNRKG
ncbi:helix-turn-helix domain-containing protein [Paenibacillus sp. USDA918EY]|uniref:helix-turn-helix domain-containing protein n=1 Tax=Paenibacillus sp. USDA918EY TaxID=2689575 RepID=UPI002E2A7731|nr:helix-turn-helix transcriptional regulator [Paenibacillus sp. USDA918EY]